MYKRDVARRLHFSVITKNHEEEKTLQREFDALKTKVDKDISDLRLRNKLRAKLIGAELTRAFNRIKFHFPVSECYNRVDNRIGNIAKIIG